MKIDVDGMNRNMNAKAKNGTSPSQAQEDCLGGEGIVGALPLLEETDVLLRMIPTVSLPYQSLRGGL
jgi:hypothetical protein